MAPFRFDPCFAVTLPKALDFVDPFVEPVKIIREWVGEGSKTSSAGSLAASATSIATVCRICDFGSDEESWWPERGPGRPDPDEDGELDWSVDGKPGDQFGIGIEAAGDLNRDGIPDVEASAPGAGKAYIFSGKDGSVLVTTTAEDVADILDGTSLARAMSMDTATPTSSSALLALMAGEERQTYIPAGTGSRCLP